jgi:hypothetical protein
MTKKYADAEDPVIAGRGDINIMLRAGVIMLTFAFLVSLPANLWAEYEQKNIDEMMSSRQKEIDLAFSEFSKTKSASKLAKIEKMNEDAAGSLIEWWDLSNMPCCIDRNSDSRKTLEENANKFAFYSKMICHNYAKILGHYARKNMRRKAQTIYEFIKTVFDSPDFDQCRNEAKSSMGKFRY